MRGSRLTFSDFTGHLAVSWIKHVTLYLVFVGVVFLVFSEFDFANWIEWIREMLTKGVVWLILFLGFCVGWAGAVHKSGARPFPLLVIGALITGLVGTIILAFIMVQDGPLSLEGLVVIWAGASFTLWLLISWAHFVLGIYGEWLW